MSICSSDIFDVATHLISQKELDGSQCEAKLRSAASRAYYAALHAALEVVPEEFFPSETELNSRDSHKKIFDAVAAWGNSVTPGRTEAKAIGRELPRLKRLRKTADYGIECAFSSGDAEEALARASRILENAELATAKCNPLQTA